MSSSPPTPTCRTKEGNPSVSPLHGLQMVRLCSLASPTTSSVSGLSPHKQLRSTWSTSGRCLCVVVSKKSKACLCIPCAFAVLDLENAVPLLLFPKLTASFALRIEALSKHSWYIYSIYFSASSKFLRRSVTSQRSIPPKLIFIPRNVMLNCRS